MARPLHSCRAACPAVVATSLLLAAPRPTRRAFCVANVFSYANGAVHTTSAARWCTVSTGRNVSRCVAGARAARPLCRCRANGRVLVRTAPQKRSRGEPGLRVSGCACTHLGWIQHLPRAAALANGNHSSIATPPQSSDTAPPHPPAPRTAWFALPSEFVTTRAYGTSAIPASAHDCATRATSNASVCQAARGRAKSRCGSAPRGA